jgi:hypothetical protein
MGCNHKYDEEPKEIDIILQNFKLLLYKFDEFAEFLEFQKYKILQCIYKKIIFLIRTIPKKN